MLPILELPLVRQQAVSISVATYHAMAGQGLVERNTELLRGVIVEKMSKSPLHEFLADQLYRLAADAAEEAGPAGMVVRKEAPLTLADSEPEPDVAVVRGKPADFRRAHPTTAVLVMEVAVSSAEIDREKGFIYAEAGVAEFWLVLPASATIEIYGMPRDGRYQKCAKFTHPQAAQSSVLPALSIDLETLFAE